MKEYEWLKESKKNWNQSLSLGYRAQWEQRSKLSVAKYRAERSEQSELSGA